MFCLCHLWSMNCLSPRSSQRFYCGVRVAHSWVWTASPPGVHKGFIVGFAWLIPEYELPLPPEFTKVLLWGSRGSFLSMNCLSPRSSQRFYCGVRVAHSWVWTASPPGVHKGFIVGFAWLIPEYELPLPPEFTKVLLWGSRGSFLSMNCLSPRSSQRFYCGVRVAHSWVWTASPPGVHKGFIVGFAWLIPEYELPLPPEFTKVYCGVRVAHSWVWTASPSGVHKGFIVGFAWLIPEYELPLPPEFTKVLLWGSRGSFLSMNCLSPRSSQRFIVGFAWLIPEYELPLPSEFTKVYCGVRVAHSWVWTASPSGVHKVFIEGFAWLIPEYELPLPPEFTKVLLWGSRGSFLSMNCLSPRSSQRFYCGVRVAHSWVWTASPSGVHKGFIVGFAWLIPEYELPLPPEFTKVYCGVRVAHSWVWTASPSGVHKGFIVGFAWLIPEYELPLPPEFTKVLLWGSRGSFLSMNCLSPRSSQRFIVGFAWLIPEYELPLPPEFTKVLLWGSRGSFLSMNCLSPRSSQRFYCGVRVAHSWVWTASPPGVHKGLLWGSRGSFLSMNCLSLRSSQRFIVGFAWLIPEYELPLPPEFTKFLLRGSRGSFLSMNCLSPRSSQRFYCGVRVAHSWVWTASPPGVHKGFIVGFAWLIPEYELPLPPEFTKVLLWGSRGSFLSMNCLSPRSSQRFYCGVRVAHSWVWTASPSGVHKGFIVGFAWLIPEYELPLPPEFTKVLLWGSRGSFLSMNCLSLRSSQRFYCVVRVAHSWVWTASPPGVHKGFIVGFAWLIPEYELPLPPEFTKVLLWGSRGSFLSMNCLSLRSSQRFIVGFAWLIPEYELPLPLSSQRFYCGVRVAHSWVWTASPSGVHKGFIGGFAWLIPEYELPLPPEFTKVLLGGSRGSFLSMNCLSLRSSQRFYWGVRVAHSWVWTASPCGVHKGLLWGSRGSFLSMNCLSLRSSQRFIVGFAWLIPELSVYSVFIHPCLSSFFWSLYYPSLFHVRLLITSLVSSNCSC